MQTTGLPAGLENPPFIPPGLEVDNTATTATTTSKSARRSLRLVVTPDERSLVTSTTTFPWSAVAMMQLKKVDDARANYTNYCSAVMVGAHIALTSASCLYDHDTNRYVSKLTRKLSVQ